MLEVEKAVNSALRGWERIWLGWTAIAADWNAGAAGTAAAFSPSSMGRDINQCDCLSTRPPSHMRHCASTEISPSPDNTMEIKIVTLPPSDDQVISSMVLPQTITASREILTPSHKCYWQSWDNDNSVSQDKHIKNSSEAESESGREGERDRCDGRGGKRESEKGDRGERALGEGPGVTLVLYMAPLMCQKARRRDDISICGC